MKALATRIAELEARAAAQQRKDTGPTPEAIERFKRRIAAIPLERERETRAEACMTTEQQLQTVQREISWDEDQAAIAEKAGRIELARVYRLGLTHKRDRLKALLTETRGEPAAPATDAAPTRRI